MLRNPLLQHLVPWRDMSGMLSHAEILTRLRHHVATRGNAAKVARFLDLPPSRISELVGERRKLKPDEMVKLAEYLGMTGQPVVMLPVQMPSAERLENALATLLRGVGLHEAADEHAHILAQRLPAVLAQAAMPATYDESDDPATDVVPSGRQQPRA